MGQQTAFAAGFEQKYLIMKGCSRGTRHIPKTIVLRTHSGTNSCSPGVSLFQVASMSFCNLPTSSRVPWIELCTLPFHQWKLLALRTTRAARLRSFSYSQIETDAKLPTPKAAVKARAFQIFEESMNPWSAPWNGVKVRLGPKDDSDDSRFPPVRILRRLLP